MLVELLRGHFPNDGLFKRSAGVDDSARQKIFAVRKRGLRVDYHEHDLLQPNARHHVDAPTLQKSRAAFRCLRDSVGKFRRGDFAADSVVDSKCRRLDASVRAADVNSRRVVFDFDSAVALETLIRGVDDCDVLERVGKLTCALD